jgi:ribosomal protein S18 acetylase RimI-like enzyme
LIRIRLSTEADVPLLGAVEESAATLFSGLSVGVVESRTVDPALLMKLCQKGTLWVAANEKNVPVGFLASYPLDGFLYIHEISVSRESQGHGVGRRLMNMVEDYALEHNYPYIGLTTFRDVRWNGPFYKSLGYKEIEPDRYSGLHNKFKDDIRQGLNPAQRCTMIKVIED